MMKLSWKNSSIPIGLFIFSIIAELLASRIGLAGPPMDWGGKPFDFVKFEGNRMRIWIVCGPLLTGLWWFACCHLRWRRSVSRVLSFGGVILICEVVTSLFFWKSLTQEDKIYLGSTTPQDCILEHLIGWLLVWFVGIGIWLLFRVSKVGSSRN